MIDIRESSDGIYLGDGVWLGTENGQLCLAAHNGYIFTDQVSLNAQVTENLLDRLAQTKPYGLKITVERDTE